MLLCNGVNGSVPILNQLPHTTTAGHSSVYDVTLKCYKTAGGFNKTAKNYTVDALLIGQPRTQELTERVLYKRSAAEADPEICVRGRTLIPLLPLSSLPLSPPSLRSRAP